MYDVIVIGGGPAGLQAGLTLGRVHRPALVLDSGEYRNAPAGHMHNVIGQDGTPPAELRAVARKEIERYGTVEVHDAAAAAVRALDDGFEVELVDGRTERARRLLLATGLRDRLPEIPGLAEVFGDLAAHCPFCHGHELAGGTVAISAGPHAAMLAGTMSRIAGRLVIVGSAEAPEVPGAETVAADIAEVRRDGERARLMLDDGRELLVDGLIVSPRLEQSAPFAEQLGLTLLSSGCVEVDVLGRTSLAGVSAAGDLAHVAALPMPLASVINAAAAGQVAASGLHHDLVMAEAGSLAG